MKIILNKSKFILFFLVFLVASSLSGGEFLFQSSDDWHGYKRHVYKNKDEGYTAFVVRPKKGAKGYPWIWRARFFGHEPQLDLSLLDMGYHLAYCDVSQLFGSPKAVQRWDLFYAWAREEYALAQKVILEGMSRGGLVVYNWAVANPDKVSLIYADNPVIDIRSWPGGKGIGKGSPNDWSKCLKVYGVDEKKLNADSFLPTSRLKKLAQQKVPLLHIVGLSDKVVPVEENTSLIEEKYKQLQGPIKIIKKPGVGHHPHSLKDVTPILDYIINSSL